MTSEYVNVDNHDESDDDEGLLPTHLELSKIVGLGTLPAVAMMICTLLGLKVKVPKSTAGALQHFAAGVLLSAIATELLPPLTQAHGWDENVGLTIGFVLGMGLLIVLGLVLPEEEEEDDEKDEKAENGRGGGGVSQSITSLLNHKRESRMSRGYKHKDDLLLSASIAAQLEETEGLATERNSLLTNDVATTTIPKQQEQQQQQHPKSFPTQFLIAIIVDSFLDGLLIGIASAAGPGAGPMMAASLCVEMAFLGLTLATALHGLPFQSSIPASLAGPLTLVAGSTCGGLLSGALHSRPPLFAGMMGFGTSALLFMVAEELLLEAHEDGGAHIWWVDVQLYVGFYCSFMSAKLIGE